MYSRDVIQRNMIDVAQGNANGMCHYKSEQSENKSSP